LTRAVRPNSVIATTIESRHASPRFASKALNAGRALEALREQALRRALVLMGVEAVEGERGDARSVRRCEKASGAGGGHAHLVDRPSGPAVLLRLGHRAFGRQLLGLKPFPQTLAEQGVAVGVEIEDSLAQVVARRRQPPGRRPAERRRGPPNDERRYRAHPEAAHTML
jgi:hypothetical protein